MLPACPSCSSIHGLVRPVWHHNKMTSAKSGRPTYSLLGCRHAQACDKEGFRDSSEGWSMVEAAWKDVCENLFDVKTLDWTDERRREFKEKLEGTVILPNVTLPLPLPEPEAVRANYRDPSGTDDDPPF